MPNVTNNATFSIVPLLLDKGSNTDYASLDISKLWRCPGTEYSTMYVDSFPAYTQKYIPYFEQTNM